jgi:Nif-specific regulatory protein
VARVFQSSTPAQWSDVEPRASEGEPRELSLVREISQLLAEQADLRAAFKQAVQSLTSQNSLGITGAMVFVPGKRGDEDDICVAEGSTLLRPRGPAAPDALSLADQVVQRGRPVVVPRIARTPSLRPGGDPSTTRDLSLVAAPILFGGHAAGALSVEFVHERERDLHRALGYVSVLASAVAQAVAGSRRAQERQRLSDETIDLRNSMLKQAEFPRLVGTSAPLGEVQTQVAQVASADTTVLLRGESGTGKGLIAQAIHHNSPRARKPFVTVSCASLPADLIESELFGYEAGAFTGAHGTKRGRLETANGGTLFLDEVGELTPAVQVKLLRVLQEREFERLGGTQTISLNVRVLAATNRNLEKAIAAGEFREDLYYRLNVFSIFVPPLRDRKADILLLADHFLERFAREHGKNVRRISTPAIDMLASYHWPGNVRELSNAIERAVVLCDGGVVHAHHLPPTLQTAESSGTAANQSLQEMVEAVEKDALQDALKQARGNRAVAARLLRTTRRIFNYKVRNYAIDWRRFE